MNDTQRWQADAVRSARTRDLPSAAALENMWRGVEARVAAAAPDPLAQEPADVTAAPLTTNQRWQAWALGGLLAAAAALALTMGLQGTASTREGATQNDAAAYDAQSTDGQSEAVRRRPAGSQRPAQRPAPTLATLPTAPVDPPVAESPPVASQAPPPRSRKAAAPRKPAPAPAPDPAPATNVAGEAQALRKAHAAMEAGRLREALAELGKYRKAFPGGVLEPEAQGLRVLIGCKREGEAGNASKRARTFLRAHPKSMLRPRLQSACKNLDAPETDAADSRH